MNFVLNLIFIRKYGAYGACIGTIVAEFFVMLYQIVCTKNFIDYKNVIKFFIKYLYKCIAMALIIIVIGCLIKNIYLKLLLQVSISALFYFCINFNYIKYDFLGKERKK